jgi:hypothetical protein
MNAQKLSIKLFLEDPSQAHGLKLLPIFQTWIQLHAMDDHLMIDVADYDHVPDGPGTVLVTHEANLYLDHIGGRPGLLYQRKQPLTGPFAERLRSVLRHTLAAAKRLEEYPGLRFRADEIQFKIHDRLLAPNTPETFVAVKADLQSVFGTATQLDHNSDPSKLFEVTIRSQSGRTVSDWLSALHSISTVS